jgi:hypothetical protein
MRAIGGEGVTRASTYAFADDACPKVRFESDWVPFPAWSHVRPSGLHGASGRA